MVAAVTSGITTSRPFGKACSMASLVGKGISSSALPVITRVGTATLRSNNVRSGLKAIPKEAAATASARCRAMMERFIKACPDLWDEDIGVPEGADR